MSKEDFARLPYFDWDKAKFFYYIAKMGSFTEAAKFVSISQSSLTRKVQVLEDHLKCKLFIRNPRGVALTRKGEQLFVIVEQAFISLKGFNYENAAMTNDGKKRKIRISTTHAFASYIFSDLMLEYSKEHPQVAFELIGEDRLIDLFLNDVDIAIRPFELRKERTEKRIRGVKYDHLFSVEKKLYASAEYLKKYGEPQSIADLKDHHLLAFSHPEELPYGDAHWILTLGMPAGKFREPVFTSNSIDILVEAAKKGIGIVSSYEEFNVIKKSNLINILPDVKDEPLREYLISPEYLEKDELIKDIKSYLRTKLELLQKTG